MAEATAKIASQNGATTIEKPTRKFMTGSVMVAVFVIQSVREILF